MTRSPASKVAVPSMPASATYRPAFLFQCREGFESDVAAEFGATLERLAAAGVPDGYVRAQGKSGHASYVFSATQAAPHFSRDVRTLLADLVFPRQTTFTLGSVRELPETAKAAPLADAIANLFAQAYPDPSLAPELEDLVLEAPDTNDGKELAAFCRTFGPHLRKALTKVFPGFGTAEVGRDPTLPRPVAIHVYFHGWAECLVGLSLRGVTSHLPMGIPRLRFPSAAPSRSTLKLEEALLTFLSEDEQAVLLRPGVTAVDLGACPGGWTYQFVRREMYVTAIDNGAIDPSLMTTGLVEHLRVDGFTYRPRKPVTWMVCDMVEKPSRIARLASEWFIEGNAGHIVFNLKLPMKSRSAEVDKCLKSVAAALLDAGLAPVRDYVLRCRQLYHDREEVTCYLGKPPRSPRVAGAGSTPRRRPM